jgi:tellurite resistance protein
MRRLLTVAVAAVVATTVLVGGCSRSDLSPDTWAVTICDALATWRRTITEINQRAATVMTRVTTIEETRRTLVGLVSDARDATEAARAAVAAAGVPDVSGGEAVTRALEQSLAATRDAYEAAAEDLRALPGGDGTAFYDGVVDVMERLMRRYEQASADLAELDTPELRTAFERAPECQ